STIDVSIPENKDLLKSVKNAAVTPIEIKENKNLGAEFSESIAHYFIKHKRIQIVARNRKELDQILGEQKASRAAIFDEETVVDMGKIQGVDVIMSGVGELKEVNSKPIIHKYRLKMINVETGVSVLSVTKEPGIEWTPFLLFKYIIGFGYIWNKEDILIESSTVNHLSEQTVKQILHAIEKVEKKNSKN
ncbi:MAG: hypothetical protein KDK36_16245, partial [Leptospiraceae bacterium]|nr:hypothetical protein [Leptospiraceae bacterium]